MRSKPWLPTVVFSSESAPALIPAKTCGLFQGKQRLAPIAGTQTLQNSGAECRAGNRYSQAFHSLRPCPFLHWPVSRDFEVILLDVVGNQSPSENGQASYRTVQLNLSGADRTKAGRLHGGIGLLPCLQGRAFGINLKSYYPMESRLSHLRRCTGWRAGISAGYTGPQSAYHNRSLRFQ